MTLIKINTDTEHLNGKEIPANMEVLQETGLAKVYKTGEADIGKFLDKQIADKNLNEQDTKDENNSIYKSDLVTKFCKSLPKKVKYFKFRINHEWYYDLALEEMPEQIRRLNGIYISPEEYVAVKLKPLIKEMETAGYRDMDKAIEIETLKTIRQSPQFQKQINSKGV